MAKQKTTKRRTQVKTLPKKKKELTKGEQQQIKGASQPAPAGPKLQFEQPPDDPSVNTKFLAGQ
jgi:hypothetical protein